MNDIVWLVSYPRSGNTWLRFLIANIQHPETDVNYRSIDELVPDWHQKDHKWQPDESFDWSPVAIKSHWIYVPNYDKVIYLYRDPRDVVLSCYHFSQGDWDIRFEGTFDEYLRKVFILGGRYGRWDRHVYFWASGKSGIPFILIKYEDLWQHLYREVKRIIDFLGIKVRSATEVQAAIDKSDFNELEKIRARDGVHPKKKGLRGRPGGWRENLTEKQKDLIWEKFGKTMEKLGYSKGGIK